MTHKSLPHRGSFARDRRQRWRKADGTEPATLDGRPTLYQLRRHDQNRAWLITPYLINLVLDLGTHLYTCLHACKVYSRKQFAARPEVHRQHEKKKEALSWWVVFFFLILTMHSLGRSRDMCPVSNDLVFQAPIWFHFEEVLRTVTLRNFVRLFSGTLTSSLWSWY